MGYIISGGSVNVDNNTIKKNAQGQLYVNAVSPLTTTSGVGLQPSTITTIQKGSPNPPSTIPSGINSNNYLQINITNNQSTATPTNFQQMIQLQGLPQPPNQAEFFDANGNVYTSWLESYNNGVATWWVLLPNGIRANSTTTLYLGFSSSNSTLLNGTTVGANPTWTSTYGQYDNGASVFNFYDNFAGTSLSSKWTISNVTASVNNGLTITGSNSNQACLLTATTFPQNQYVEEWYGTFASQTGTSYSQQGFGFNINSGACSTGGLSICYGSGSPPSFQGYTGLWSLYETATSGSYGYFYYNYTTLEATVTAYSGSYGWGWGLQANDKPFQVQWARMRALPPNGVMPSIQIYSSTYQFSAYANLLKNKNTYSNYVGSITTSTTPMTIQSINFTPSISGLVEIKLIAKVSNNTVNDGVYVGLYNGSTLLDGDSYTQVGLASNPHYIVLYYEGLYPIGTQQTFNVKFNAITGGTAYCEIQEFTIEEV
jgi:hypothetical protein